MGATKFRLRPLRGQTKVIDLGGLTSIGRGPENSITIFDEKASRKHCVIEPYGDGAWAVRDLGSRNGTRVNDAKVVLQILRPGDVVAIGAHEWLYESAAPAMAFSVDEAAADLPKVSAEEAMKQTSVAWMFELSSVMGNIPPKDEPPEPVQVADADGRKSEALEGTSDGPNAIRLLLQLASKCRATDIHIEPRIELYHIRMRVDGDMVPIVDLPKRVGELCYGLIKTACNMQIVARTAVQEGHFSAVFPDRQVEYRVSFTPSVYGQKLVLRVLDSRGIPQSLLELGMAGYMIDRIKRVCEQDSGLLLVCGPTGSGKSTTLFQALRVIDRTARNVVTIEDPVEYKLEGATQIPIDEARGNTFGNLLRSVLRQDPDVILVGEIRDEETARTAMQAAMTGHVVFSTIHAKDTISSVFRLLDLKVEPYLVANSLDLILAQRLVRVLCENCRRPIRVAPGQASRLGKWLQGKSEIFTATGCARCLRTGYRGRRAVFELLDFNDELRDIVLHNPSIAAMKKIIEGGHFTTLQQSGWKLVADGQTSLDEVDRVTAAAR
jgi:general secretion pathway protein E